MSDQPKRVFGKPFEAGNAGRPEGARSKLSKSFVERLFKDFEEHGAPTIVLARMEDPLGYLKIVASLLPRQITGEDGSAIATEIVYRWAGPKPE